MISPRTVFFIVLIYAVYFEPALSKDGSPTKTSFEDARCKCVCPKFKKDDNSTLSDKTVYISPNADPANCNCGFVVSQPQVTCSMCECKYENRNTTTIKVVVIIIICVTSLLLVYMLFLLCLDPLIARRPGSYQEHMDEDDQSVSQVPQFEGARPRMARQKSVINYVSDEQKRWKIYRVDCKDILDKNPVDAVAAAKSGVYEIKLSNSETLPVYCDMDTDGGGWTVFQNRYNGSVDFRQNFSTYEHGFGDVNGEFWLGLKYVKELTEMKSEVRFDLDLLKEICTKHTGASSFLVQTTP